MKKMFFRSNSPLFTHLLLFFTKKTNIQNVYIETSTGRLQDPVEGSAGDQIMGRSGHVPATSVIHVFLNSTQKHI